MPIAPDVSLGPGVRVLYPDLVNLYGCTIGPESQIGPFVEIQSDVVVGARCKITAPLPIDAPCFTSIRANDQSAGVCNFPLCVARGYWSFVNMTPCPTNTNIGDRPSRAHPSKGSSDHFVAGPNIQGSKDQVQCRSAIVNADAVTDTPGANERSGTNRNSTKDLDAYLHLPRRNA